MSSSPVRTGTAGGGHAEAEVKDFDSFRPSQSIRTCVRSNRATTKALAFLISTALLLYASVENNLFNKRITVHVPPESHPHNDMIVATIDASPTGAEEDSVVNIAASGDSASLQPEERPPLDTLISEEGEIIGDVQFLIR